jgi:hypothetical protein
MLIAGSALALIVVVVILWQVLDARQDQNREALEAQKVLEVQPDIPFEILIPSYLPDGFIREDVQLDATQPGPSGEPMIQLTYPTEEGEALYLREWIPLDPSKEILAGSRPVETSWGPGWLRTQGRQLIVLWADVGSVRVSTFANSQEVVSPDEVFRIVSTLTPASQVGGSD